MYIFIDDIKRIRARVLPKTKVCNIYVINLNEIRCKIRGTKGIIINKCKIKKIKEKEENKYTM